MASIDFYALKDDIRELVQFIFAEKDIRVFESYSRFDTELREFRSYEDLTAAFNLGTDAHGNGTAVLLQLWSSAVMRRIQFERIALKVPGHTFRYRVDGVGLMQLHFGGDHKGVVTDSHFGNWNEAGARQRASGDGDAVDWPALSRVSGRIQRYIRNKMAVAKVRERPILPAAFTALQGGMALRYSALQFRADSPDIKVLREPAD